MNQRLAAHLLESRGHHVTIANNGREALELLEKQPFDLALVDVQMPEMDGLQLTGAIREKEKNTNTHLPIIAMTAYAMKGDRERCLEAGMDAYVSKPINASQLFETIDGLGRAELKVPEEAEGGSRLEILDEAALRSRFEGELELLRDVVRLFLDDYPKLFNGIRGAAERGDTKGMEREAHKLKGSVANFAAPAAYDAALRLEMMGRSGHLEQGAEALDQLESALDRVAAPIAEPGWGHETMKILVAEDDLVTRRILEAYLVKWGYEAVMVADGQEAWRLLQQDDAPSLAILDWMMPGLDGTTICREVRKLNRQPYIYLILLTARGYKEHLIEGLEAGADEYLTKPFDPYELKARLRAGARIVELQDSLIQAREALREQAMHDPLTLLLNRRASLDFLLSELARAKREHHPLSLMMVDIDFFKSVNDRFGHLGGDEVLCEVARRLRKSARTYDLVGRFGGEEFLIVAPGCGAAQGLVQAERLREVVGSQPITLKDRFGYGHDQRGSGDDPRSQPGEYGGVTRCGRQGPLPRQGRRP